MGSSYLPPPEQNVVNVGDEISQTALDAINAASFPSGTNPFRTLSDGGGISSYDNFKVYAAGDLVIAEEKIYRFNSPIGAAGYGPITHPYAWTIISGNDGYALLSGATFSGKVSMAAPTAGSASFNLGVGTAPTTSVAGDMWISTNINFKDSSGTQKVAANTNTSNTYNAPQIIQTPAGTVNAALRVTQLGTGNALVVEDGSSINPDTTAFVIDQHGKVGIGGAAPAGMEDKVAVYGGNIALAWPYAVKFGDGSQIRSSSEFSNQIQGTVQQGIINYIFSGSQIYSGSGSVYGQHLAYYDSANNYDVYADYLSYTFDYSVNWSSLNMSFTQTNSSPIYPSQYTIVGSYYDGSGSGWSIRANGYGGVEDVIQN